MVCGEAFGFNLCMEPVFFSAFNRNNLVQVVKVDIIPPLKTVVEKLTGLTFTVFFKSQLIAQILSLSPAKGTLQERLLKIVMRAWGREQQKPLYLWIFG